MTKVIVKREAQNDVRSIATFYRSGNEALKSRFLDEIQSYFEKIRERPLLYPLLEKGYRRCVVQTFPYEIIFKFDQGVVVVIGVIHQRRMPGAWKDRVD